MEGIKEPEIITPEELEEALSVIKEFKTPPVRGYAFKLRAKQFLRAPFDVLFVRALCRNIAYIVNKDIDYNLLDNSNIVIVVFGLKRVGKSELLKKLAAHIKVRSQELGVYPNPEIHLSFSNDETTAIIKHKANPGDIIWQDEIIEQSGEDSLTQKRQIFNLQENLAAKHIHFLFSSNKKRGFEEISNFVLLPTHKDREERANKAMVFYKSELDGRLVPLGLMKLPLSEDPELTEIYKIRKQSYVDSLKDSGGFAMVKVDPIRASQDIETVESLMEKELEEVSIFDWKKSWIHSFVREAYVLGSNAYLDYIGTKIEINIVKKKALCKRELEISKEEEEPLLENPTDFIDFLKADIERALVTKGIFPDRAKAKRYSTYYFSGQKKSWEQVTEELKEKELSDSIRKYVSNRRTKAKRIVEVQFERSIAYWLNQEIFGAESSPECSDSFQANGSKGSCDIFIGSCPGTHRLSINAKLNLGDRSSYQHPLSPEIDHCPTNTFVFDWTRTKGLFIARSSQKNFKRGSGEEFSLDSFIDFVKKMLEVK